MSELPVYRVETKQRLSWFTEETLIGGLLPLAIPAFGLLLVPVGAVAGALFGRARIERENEEGKLVPPPTLLNKTMMVGLVIGLAATAGVAMLTMGSAFTLTALLTGSIGATPATAALVLGAVASAVTGAWYGAVNGRHRMEAEYHYARMYGDPMDGPKMEQEKTPQKALEIYDDLEPTQKRYVEDEIKRRMQREKDKDAVGK